MTKKEHEKIGEAAVDFCGKALFFCMDGGSFKHEGVEGTFAATVGGASIILYIGEVAYQCGVEGIIRAAVEHYKTLPEAQAKAKPKAKTDGV